MAEEEVSTGPQMLGVQFVMDPDAVMAVEMGPAKFMAFTIEQMVTGLLKVDDNLDWETFRLEVTPTYDPMYDSKTLQFRMSVMQKAS